MASTGPTTIVALVLIAVGYCWLLILSTQLHALHQRLGRHICRDPEPIIPTGPTDPGGSISVAELLDREDQYRNQHNTTEQPLPPPPTQPWYDRNHQ